MDLEEYLKVKYNGDREKMILEELNSMANQQRLYEVEQKKDYLMGFHRIKNLPTFQWNGSLIEPRKIVLQTAKTLIQQQSQFLLRHPVVLTGSERMVDELSKVNRSANFNSKNKIILDNLLKFGCCSELLFINKEGMIDSKVIPADQGFPIWNHHNEMIGFVQSFRHDSITYMTLFTEDIVYEYSNEGGNLHLVSSSPNLGGLPIYYKTHSEYSDTEGRSILDDIIPIIDDLEMLISRQAQATLLYSQGIPILKGQRLQNSGIPQDVIGGGLLLDYDAEFTFASNPIATEAFESTYDKLMTALMDVSGVPSVALSKFEISNISETSIRMLHSLSEIKGHENEAYMREGLLQRYDRVCRMLSYKSIEIGSDDLSLIFTYNYPQNESERIDNILKLKNANAVSMETLLENSPYTAGSVAQEVERMKMEGIISGNIRVDTSEDNSNSALV